MIPLRISKQPTTLRYHLDGTLNSKVLARGNTLAYLAYSVFEQVCVMSVKIPSPTEISLKFSKFIFSLLNHLISFMHVSSGHLSAVRKWGGKTSDFAKSGGAKPKIHGKYK